MAQPIEKLRLASIRAARRAACRELGADVPEAFSAPLSPEILDTLGTQLVGLLAAYDEASTLAALGEEANLRLGPRAPGGELKPVRQRNGGLAIRVISQPEFVRRCRETDAELPVSPTFWMYLAIAAQIDQPIATPGEREWRRKEWARLLDSVLDRGETTTAG